MAFQRDNAEFSKGFTIIVGPNWSGKSTIYQGIKFALGSNERDERYTKWSDFIRTGQNHALVELYIQTPDELLGIRRTVLRGKAPFFEIKHNNDKEFKRIHSLEIRDLVKSLNYNPDNQFSFISQGKIDAFKDMKPEELCVFLEEGVGLKGLRTEILEQKDQVSNLQEKLKALKTEQNSWNFELKLLEPKLKKLKEKQILLDDKKNLEYELLWANRDKIKKEIYMLEEDIKKISIIIDELQKQLESFNSKISDIKKKIDQINNNSEAISEDIGKLKGRITELEKIIQQWRTEQQKIKVRLEELERTKSEIKKKLDNNKAKEKKISTELKLSRKNIKELDSAITNIVKEQQELMEKVSTQKEFLERFNRKKADLNAKQDKIIQNTQKITETNEKIDDIFKEIRDISHHLEKNKWFLENKDKDLQENLINQRRTLDKKIHEVEGQLREIRRNHDIKLNAYKRLNYSIREKRVFLPSNIVSLKEEIFNRNLNAQGPIIELLQYDDKLGYAIESVLGKKVLFSFIAGDWNTFVLLKKLKDNHNAYCNIYLAKEENIRPFSKYEKIEGVLGYLAELIKIKGEDEDIRKLIYSKVKNCLVVEDFTTGTLMHKNYKFRGKCVTLKGEQIISYDYVVETPYLKKLEGLLSPTKQMDQLYLLEMEINTLSDERKNLESIATKLDQKYREISKKIETLPTLELLFRQEHRLLNKKDSLFGIRKELNELNDDLELEIENLEKAVESFKEQQKPEFFEWQKRIEKIPEELNLKSNEKERWSKIKDEKQKSLSEIQEIVNEDTAEFTKIDFSYNEIRKEFQNRDQKAFQIFQELTELENQIKDLKIQKEKLEVEKRDLQEEENRIRQENLELNLNYERKQDQLNSFQNELQFKNLDLEKINKEIGPKVLSKEIEIRPIEEIQNKLFETNKKLMKYAGIDETLEVEKERIIKTLKKIAQNQAQIQKDLKEAEETEENLENTYYKKFNKIIQKLESLINIKFETSEIQAKCSIELSGKFENLGVKIKAALLNEQFRGITALSGGQRSIIAICLILSLQEFKSSRIIVLDEAEIYLDENNAEIAYKLIKATIRMNKIQIIIFMPKASKYIYKMADKLIGVARNGPIGPSTILQPKIIKT